MHIAAIYNLPDRKDDLAEALAAALGTTAYEACSRLRLPGSGMAREKVRKKLLPWKIVPFKVLSPGPYGVA
jgi:hypothetical protein